MSCPVIDDRVPWQVWIALPAGGLSAVLVLMAGLVGITYAADVPGGPVPGILLVLLAATQFTGAVLLRLRRDWRLLAGASGTVAVLALLLSGAGLVEDGMDVGRQTALPLLPIVAAVLAASSGPRCWTASRPAR